MLARIDGRRLRSRRTEERLVAAYLELVAESGTPPTCSQVAARAGCSVRTLFDRFRDMAHLARTAVARPPPLDRASRIRLYVAARARLCEHWLSLSARRPDAPAVREELSGLAEIEALYEPELSLLETAERRRLLIVLGTLTDVGGWAGIRRRYGRSMAEACDVWHAAIDRLLPPTPAAARLTADLRDAIPAGTSP